MGHYDIAVIGAGAAGLAAGLRLQSAGKSFIVLEARDRIGGRAFTDTATLGLPFDCGAHWLHAAAQNPFTTIADRLGFRYARMAWSDYLIHTAGAPAPNALIEDASMEFGRAMGRIAEAGQAGLDVAFSDCVGPAGRWTPLIRQIIGQITSHDPEDCSTRDYARYEDGGGDYPVEAGFGALVASNAAGLPVTLSTPVTLIDWSGRLVRLETPRGTLTARTVILAVPVNVLIAEGIRFAPALPAALIEAFHDCPMGVSEKIALLLDGPVEGLGHLYGDVVDLSEQARPPFNLHVNPFGRPLLVSHLAGSWGREMEKLSDAAAMAVALEALAEAFGASMKKRVVRMLRTHWASDPHTLGGYSHAKPGRADSRFLFSEPVGERIVLAGEHCSIPFYSTVHGAHLSGIAAAETAMGLVRP
ncbi:flavin monoamine oxidase family protein [Aestuariivirga sp.]|uniref:flavin monoamine oxidase family protein n=1 Tax=Aestuariivirga sp. TaxID=2650926 RepID=UPI00391B1156